MAQQAVKYDEAKPPLVYNYHVGWQVLTQHLQDRSGPGQIRNQFIDCYLQCCVALDEARGAMEEESPDRERAIRRIVTVYFMLKQIYSYELYDQIAAVSWICKHGADKYGYKNYTYGMQLERMCSAALRHIGAIFVRGELTDPETGYEHVFHAYANLLILLELIYD